MTCHFAEMEGKCVGTEQQGKGQGIMRGLVGDRLLKRFFDSVVHRPGFDPPSVLDAKLDNGEEAVQPSYNSSPEKAQGRRESEEPEAENAVTRSSDVEN